jgi:hypothetical protein
VQGLRRFPHTGTIFLVEAVATLAGPAVAGSFLPTVTQQNFNKLIIFTGVMIMGGAACLAVAYVLNVREKRMQEEEGAGSRGGSELQVNEVAETGSHEADANSEKNFASLAVTTLSRQSTRNNQQ